jgi:hypothetical protein
MKRDINPQSKNTPVNADKNDKPQCCGMKKPVSIPAITMVHQGK